MQKISPAIDLTLFKSDAFIKFHNPIRILSIGRLTWVKGYEYLLKTLSILKKNKINFECHIVGEGNYKEAMIFSIHQLGLADQVKLKGRLPHHRVKMEMEWADIYVQPSIEEGFCNSVLEAQAMGLICIVSDAGGLTENILNKETGWVVPKRSSKLFADAINEVINSDINHLNKISQKAINRVKKLYNLKDHGGKWCAFYKDM